MKKHYIVIIIVSLLFSAIYFHEWFNLAKYNFVIGAGAEKNLLSNTNQLSTMDLIFLVKKLLERDAEDNNSEKIMSALQIIEIRKLTQSEIQELMELGLLLDGAYAEKFSAMLLTLFNKDSDLFLTVLAKFDDNNMTHLVSNLAYGISYEKDNSTKEKILLLAESAHGERLQILKKILSKIHDQ